MGFSRAGGDKSLADFEIAPFCTVIMGDDVEKCRIPVKHNLALYIGGMGARDKNFYNDYAKRLGYEEAAVEIQNLFLDGKKMEAAMAVPDALVDEVHLIGSADEIRDRLSRWREAGSKRHVDTMLIGTGQPEALELPENEGDLEVGARNLGVVGARRDLPKEHVRGLARVVGIEVVQPQEEALVAILPNELDPSRAYVPPEPNWPLLLEIMTLQEVHNFELDSRALGAAVVVEALGDQGLLAQHRCRDLRPGAIAVAPEYLG